MARTICPQLRGIYENNNADKGDGKYRYWLIPDNNPDFEYWAVDAYPVDKQGNIKPDYEFPIPCLPDYFGNYVADVVEQ